jgi:Na+/phosphate symporter
MAKAIMETSPDINLNISTDEIVRVSVDTSGAFRENKYRVKSICTKMEKQNVYMNDFEEELTEYNTRLVEMKTRVAEVQDDMKKEYLSQVENLENIRNLFAVKYGKLKKPSGDVWDDLKVAIEEAWSELEFY